MSLAEVEALNREADRLGDIYHACVREMGHAGCLSEADAYQAAVRGAQEANYRYTQSLIQPAIPQLALPPTLEAYEERLRAGLPGMAELGEAIREYEVAPVQAGLVPFLEECFPEGIPEPYAPAAEAEEEVEPPKFGGGFGVLALLFLFAFLVNH